MSITKYVLKHNGGTFNNKLKAMQFQNGFMVSIKGYETKTKDINEVEIIAREYAKRINNNQFVGVWFNDDDNYYYIDISVLILDKMEALKFGRANEQLAIFNNKYKTSITL